MTRTEFDLIRLWDAKCGDNEATFFPVTKDRRRLIEHVDELRELLRDCRQQLPAESAQTLIERINAALAS